MRIHQLVMNYSHESVLIQLPVQCNSCFTLYLVYFRCIHFFLTSLAFCGQQRKNMFLYRAYDNKHFLTLQSFVARCRDCLGKWDSCSLVLDIKLNAVSGTIRTFQLFKSYFCSTSLLLQLHQNETHKETLSLCVSHEQEGCSFLVTQKLKLGQKGK